MRSKEDIEKLVQDNQRLVYYLVKKRGIEPSYLWYDDIIASGMIGLFKAAITFDESKNVKFSTYAIKCINNEIFIHGRKLQKSAKDISFEEKIANKRERRERSLKDIVEDTKSNFMENIMIKIETVEAINVILNCLEGKNRICMLYKIGGETQLEIAQKLGISQSYVARLNQKSRNTISRYYYQNVDYAEIFSFDILEDKYVISFRIMEKEDNALIEKICNSENVYNFYIDCNKVVIETLADIESFIIFAKIIQEIENNNINVIPNN